MAASLLPQRLGGSDNVIPRCAIVEEAFRPDPVKDLAYRLTKRFAITILGDLFLDSCVLFVQYKNDRQVRNITASKVAIENVATIRPGSK